MAKVWEDEVDCPLWGHGRIEAKFLPVCGRSEPLPLHACDGSLVDGEAVCGLYRETKGVDGVKGGEGGSEDKKDS
jgi:hypothetical protein